MSASRDIAGTTWDNGRAKKAAPATLATSRGPEPREILGGIVTRDKTTQEPDPATVVRWMGKVDGCPECVDNVEPPYHVEPETDAGFRAFYKCSDCREMWQTGWADDELGGPFA